jgi:hypothetical protein
MVSPALGLVADISRMIFYIGIVATAIAFFFVTWWKYVAIATVVSLIIWLIAKSQLT